MGGRRPLLGHYGIQRPDVVKQSLSFMLDRSPWEDGSALRSALRGTKGLSHTAHFFRLRESAFSGASCCAQMCPGGLRWPASSLTSPRTFAHALSATRLPPCPSEYCFQSAPGPQVTSAEEPSLIYSHPRDLAPRGLLSQIVTAGALLPCFSPSVCACPGL